MPPHSPSQRRSDTLHAFQQCRDAWIASADGTGKVHLIPRSYLWDGERLTMATPLRGRTIMREGQWIDD